MVRSDDPLTRAMAPPPGETPAARDARLAAEAEARRVSNEIDEALSRERAALKKRKVMKMLLLGQSESGAWRGWLRGYACVLTFWSLQASRLH